MSEWRADELSESEKKAFASLPRAREPLAEIEERTVAELKRRGDLRRWQRRTVWVALACCLASVAMVATIVHQVRARPPAPASPQPRWVLLLREGHEDRSVSAEESRRRVGEYASWARANKAKGLIDGEKLSDEGVLFSGGSGHPSVRTPESIAGYFLLGEVDVGKAREIARSCPHLAYGGDIELRSIETSRSTELRLLRRLGYVDDQR